MILLLVQLTAKKKTGNENVSNVNLILFICLLDNIDQIILKNVIEF
jgi:hypothetical protein